MVIALYMAGFLEEILLVIIYPDIKSIFLYSIKTGDSKPAHSTLFVY